MGRGSSVASFIRSDSDSDPGGSTFFNNSPFPQREKLALFRDPEELPLLARLLRRLFHLRHERVPEGARRARRRGRGHHGDRPVRPEVEIFAPAGRRVSRPSASASRANAVRVPEMLQNPLIRDTLASRREIPRSLKQVLPEVQGAACGSGHGLG